MTSVLIFDSSIWIDEWRAGRHSRSNSAITGLVRLSSVVYAELRRGAMKKSEVALLETLEKNYPMLTPTAKNWSDSGLVLAKMRMDKGFSTEKIRDLHFDILIALTARSYGATLITSNRTDFELIRTYRDFELEVW